jgi:TIR domain
LLEEHFGEYRVFRDIDSIEPGLDFDQAIERAIDSSEVLIAVIGKNWLTATDRTGHKRLEDPNDYVRLEIATALQRNIRVIPLLVQGAAMPSADELPDDLALLARRNAFELHDSSWRSDVQRLITRLDKVLEESGPDWPPSGGPTPPEPIPSEPKAWLKPLPLVLVVLMIILLVILISQWV